MLEVMSEPLTDRLPSLAQVAAILSQQDQLTPVLLGRAADGNPILMWGPLGESESEQRLLIYPQAGDHLLALQACLQLIQGEALPPGWASWVITPADPARHLLCEGGLGLKLTLPEHLQARRSAWGPGEHPELNLPGDIPPVWQPDHPPEGAPEGFVPVSPESRALARALHHLKPQLVVSLGDTPTGGASILSGQSLEREDVYPLLGALEEFPVQAGGKLRTGRHLHGLSGLLVLPTLREELERVSFEREHKLSGGPSAWQLAAHLQEDALYLGVELPRHPHREAGNEQPSDEQRDVTVEVDEREVGGKMQQIRVVRLHRPGHPAHEQELRAETFKGEPSSVVQGTLLAQPAASGWLAAEAWWARRAAVNRARELLDLLRPSCRKEDYVRSIQLLAAETEAVSDRLLRAYVQNKRYGRQASVAESVFWSLVYPAQTAALIFEARWGLMAEDREDPHIAQGLKDLQELAIAQLPAQLPLPASVPDGITRMHAFLQEAARLALTSGPTRTRLREQRDASTRELSAARKMLRDRKNLRAPRAEQQEAHDLITKVQAEVDRLEARLLLIDPPAESEAKKGESPAPPRAEKKPSPTPPGGEEREDPSSPPIRAGEGEAEKGREGEKSLSPQSKREPARQAEGVTPAPAEAEGREREPRGEQAAAGSSDSPPQPDKREAATPAPQEAARPSSEKAGGSERAGGSPAQKESRSGKESKPGERQKRKPQAEPAEKKVAPPQEKREERAAPPPKPKREEGGMPNARDKRGRLDWGAELALKEAELEEETVDWESVLPRVLQLEPEWGREPLEWERQRPDPDGPAWLAERANALLSQKQEEPEVLHPSAREARALVITGPDNQVIELRRSQGGFQRRRLELRRLPVEIPPPLPPVKPGGGRFFHRRRVLRASGRPPG